VIRNVARSLSAVEAVRYGSLVRTASSCVLRKRSMAEASAVFRSSAVAAFET
jgi:hypothetical protein